MTHAKGEALWIPAFPEIKTNIIESPVNSDGHCD